MRMPLTTPCSETKRASFYPRQGSSGVSKGATELRKQEFDLIQEVLSQSVRLGSNFWQSLHNIIEVSKDAADDNWDGYGAKAIDEGSRSRAIRFSQLLPTNVPVPEIYVDPDGEVTFEWYKGPRQMFSVAVRHNGELIYAGLFGASKTHGIEYLDDEAPVVILDNINRVYPDRVA